MTLVPLLAIDAPARIEALDDLSPESPGAVYAVRELLLGDDDADVRSAAAAWAVRTRAAGLPSALVTTLVTALGDALYDSHPSVRAAACTSLAKLGAREAAPTLRRLALEEPIWWVRRAAVLAVARIERRDAIGLLRAGLDDPFWRVRHAAVRALAVLGESDAALAPGIAAASAGSDRAHGALRYLARRLGLGEGAGSAAETTSSTSTSAFAASGPLADPDPAVIAARLEHGHRASKAELVEYLGDAHEALRRAAAKRLRASGDGRALLAATLWLEDPRIPHATAAVVALLDGLGPEVDELLDAVLAEPDSRPGAALWALSYVASASLWERLPEVVSALAAASLGVRRAAVSALGDWLAARDVAPDEATRADVLARLRDHLDDGDEDVRRLAVLALVRSGDRAAREVVIALPFAGQPRLVKRLVAQAASAGHDLARLAEAAADPDPETAARGLAALHAAGKLGSEAAAHARRSADPWLRGAVLDATTALDVLRDDPDPRLRRVAFEQAARAGRSSAIEAARIAATAEDAWLRARAAALFARSDDDADLVSVLRLSRDPDLAVRAAAADVTERARDFAARLAVVLAETADAEVRAAAETWLGIRAEQAMAAALIRAEQAMAAALAGARATAPAARVEQAEQAAARPEAVIANGRALGRSGLVVSPLVLSGAFEPSVASLFRALHAGCNTFFWEPRHRAMTVFLREATARGHEPLVVAGSYHASERALRRDVEQALRRLGRERLDLFLVFWTRSAARLAGEAPRALERLKRDGLVRATGFSTHDRGLACQALGEAPWDVVMVRHSAAHPGAEEQLLPRAAAAGVGVLGFSATSYGRLLRPVPGVAGGAAERAAAPATALPSAAECYRYSLAQPGICAVLSAPRGGRELIENLAVLASPTLDPARAPELRRHGRAVREESLDFGRHIRRFPIVPEGLASPLDDGLEAELLEAELTLASDIGLS